MKKNTIFSVALIAALTLSNSLNAKDQTNDSNDQEKIGSQELVSTNYSRNGLLNILSGIQNDLENRDIKAIKAKGNDISNFLKSRKDCSIKSCVSTPPSKKPTPQTSQKTFG